MVLTNADVRPRPRSVSAVTPDTPVHEVAINTWMCVERMVTPRQRGWRMGRVFCQRASPSPFSLEDPADTADSYACWTGENADEAAVGLTERVRQERTSLKEAPNASADPKRNIRHEQSNGRSRRVADVADQGFGRFNWADLCRSRAILECRCPAQSCLSCRLKVKARSRGCLPRQPRIVRIVAIHQRIFAPRTANLDLSRLLKKSLRFRKRECRRDFSQPDRAYFRGFGLAWGPLSLAFHVAGRASPLGAKSLGRRTML